MEVNIPPTNAATPTPTLSPSASASPSTTTSSSTAGSTPAPRRARATFGGGVTGVKRELPTSTSTVPDGILRATKKAKTKSVHWPSDAGLCKYRIFVSTEPIIAETDSDTIGQDMIASIPWSTPPEFVLPGDIRSAITSRGSGSHELHVQIERERSKLAKFFPANGKGIPETPTEAPDEPTTDDNKIVRIIWDADEVNQARTHMQLE